MSSPFDLSDDPALAAARQVVRALEHDHDVQTIRVHLHVHGPITLILAQPPGMAVRAVVNLYQVQNGEVVPLMAETSISNPGPITWTVSFLDATGQPAPAPAGVVVVPTSSDLNVATVGVDPANPLTGPVTLVNPGTTSIGATLTDAAGSPVLTGQAVPVPLQVDPAAVVATQAVVTLQGV